MYQSTKYSIFVIRLTVVDFACVYRFYAKFTIPSGKKNVANAFDTPHDV